MKHFIFGLDSLLLATGCIRNEIKKSGLNVFLEWFGFALMLIAYAIKL